jgi:RNA polymerase sigma-70 factor (ECF subfamily)
VSALDAKDSRKDEELFQAWLDGEGGSFEHLLARYQGRLYKVILGWTRNPHLAQDLFQETWVRVIEHKNEFDPQKKFSSWVFSIALNLTRDQFRKMKREQTEPDSDRIEMFSTAPDLHERLAARERMSKVQGALSGLSELEREVFMLRHFGEMSFAEIAQMLEINLNTALSRMHQASTRLKKMLGENR